jgi:hypothetical protein
MLETGRQILNAHSRFCEDLYREFLRSTQGLQESLSDPVSTFQFFAQSDPSHIYSYDEFCFLATFCKWESPLNFSSIPRDGATISQWLDKVRVLDNPGSSSSASKKKASAVKNPVITSFFQSHQARVTGPSSSAKSPPAKVVTTRDDPQFEEGEVIEVLDDPSADDDAPASSPAAQVDQLDGPDSQ